MKSFSTDVAVKKTAMFRIRKQTIVETISALFILLFLYTALSKSFRIVNTVDVLKNTHVLKGYETLIAWSVVTLEYIISALLFIPKTRNIGLYASLALMSAFTVYIVLMMIFVPNLPCSCGGVIQKMTWGEHIVFNLIFVALAFIGIVVQKKLSAQNNRSAEVNPVIHT